MALLLAHKLGYCGNSLIHYEHSTHDNYELMNKDAYKQGD